MLVEGDYEKIRQDILLFVDDRISNDIQVGNLIVTAGVYLNFTELTPSEKELILEEVISVIEKNVEQKRIHVEEYSANEELMSFISPH